MKLLQLKIASFWFSIQINDNPLEEYVYNMYKFSRTTIHVPCMYSIVVQNTGKILEYRLLRAGGKQLGHIAVPSSLDLPFKEFILQGIFELALLRCGVFFMHGSSLVSKLNTFIFIGSSGAGKTTIANLLSSQYEVVSDDTAIVQFSDGVLQIHKSPFDGKKDLKKRNEPNNMEVNIFALKQFTHNQIRGLSLVEKISIMRKHLNYYMLTSQVNLNEFREKSIYERISANNILKIVKFIQVRELMFNKHINSDFFNNSSY